MGQSADGDEVHAGAGQIPEPLVSDVAGYFHQGLFVDYVDGLADLLYIHVVQHDDLRTGGQGRFYFIDAGCLHLHFNQVRDCLFDFFYRLGDAAGNGDMIVFNQHAVV